MATKVKPQSPSKGRTEVDVPTVDGDVTEADVNEGEGNRTADQAYRQKATEFARSGQVEPAAERAKRDVEQNDRSNSR